MTLQSAIMESSEDSLLDELIDSPHNPAAFGELYRKYLTPVYRYLYLRVGGSAADAEDLTSQVFLDALEGLPHYRHQGHFAAWLFSIARRKAADHYRRPGADLLQEDDASPASTESDLLAQIIHQEELQDLARLIGSLSEEERELLRLRFAARLGFDEIALLLNRKTSAVKMSLYRLLERMETRLEADHE